MKNTEYKAREYYKSLDSLYLIYASHRDLIEDAFIKGEESAKTWTYTKDRLPKENYTVDVYAVRLNPFGNKELILASYEEGKFLRFNEKTCKMEEVDSVYAWKYRDELPQY